MEIPRCEYPRPQFVREGWLCLNGDWEFEIDASDSGLARGLLRNTYKSTIQVPFCPESKLSGIEHIDFMNVVWYRKRVVVPSAWNEKQVILHFQAVDYDATVWVNGQEVVRHRGGSTPFSANLGYCAGQEIEIVVRARDFQQELKPEGKQTRLYYNHTCHYTRTTGIWQTVWMEPVADTYLQRTRITPDVANRQFIIEQSIAGKKEGCTLRVRLLAQGTVISDGSMDPSLDFTSHLLLPIPAEHVHTWEPGSPFLYDLQIELTKNGQTIDTLQSYAGLRSISIDGQRVLLNGKSVFQRLVLDQGYYPEGILTAPSDADLIKDIELSMQAGFNGARLHQKVFEERFLYHADRMGYLVWGEFCDWGCNQGGPAGDNQQPGATYITQWLEELERDYSHPAIVGWCPLNETWQWLHDKITVLDEVTRGMFLAAKAMDSTRPVLDSSGYAHRVPEADIYDSHNYEQDLEKFTQLFAVPVICGKVYENPVEQGRQSLPYNDQPYFLSEFGGIWWNDALARAAAAGTDREVSWGYGDRPQTIEEVYTRFEGMCTVLLENPGYFGYCYTQLTDVFQEMNGIFDFDRKPKFDLARLHRIQTQKAAIE